MQLMMSALGAVIMMSVCGLGAFFIVADERRGGDASSSGVAAAAQRRLVPRDISSRVVDARPLTTAEVFPRAEIRAGTAASPYQVQMTHIDTDCQMATTGRLGALLTRYGCTQVVRATLATPADGYVVTAGVFNLADEQGAAALHEQIKPLVDTGAGTFAGMAAGPGTAPVELPSAQVGWNVRGHYLSYCVIARPDGRIISDDDPYARQIIGDVLGAHLRDGVIGRRAVTTG